MKNSYDVIVVGGGLAGLSCAFELSEKQKKVLLLEAKPYLGGRTSSWNERGMQVESGLHRFLSFFEALPSLIERAGVKVDDIVEWINELEIRLPENEACAVFAVSLWDKPLQSIMDIVGHNDFISPTEKLSLVKFFTAGLKDYFTDPLTLDTVTVTEYAYKYDVPDRVITRILTPLTAGLFFLPPERYSAYVFFGTMGPYIGRTYKIGEGAFKGGMTEIMANPIGEAIIRKGSDIETGVKVEQLVMHEKAVVGVQTRVEKSGEQLLLSAPQVVLATELSVAKDLISASALAEHPDFSEMLQLSTIPVVTLQLEFTEPTHTSDRVVFSPKTALACYAEQSRTTFQIGDGRLSTILTPPEQFINMSEEDVFEYIKKDAARVGIDFSKVKKYRVVSHPADFYSLTPGTEKLRPPQQTTVKGLTLAGDYTKQKYLATMEGAVTSGKLAAEVVLTRT